MIGIEPCDSVIMMPLTAEARTAMLSSEFVKWMRNPHDYKGFFNDICRLESMPKEKAALEELSKHFVPLKEEYKL